MTSNFRGKRQRSLIIDTHTKMVLDRNLKQLQLLEDVYTNEAAMDLTAALTTPGGSDVDLINVMMEMELGQSLVDRDAKWTEIEPSQFAKDTINPIRKIVDAMNVKPNPEKELLKLHIGDPTITGVLPTHPNVNAAVVEALIGGKYNGYGPAVGYPEVRKALADHINQEYAGCEIASEDIILTSGCSHALEMALEVLANPGANILVPRPGFPLYETLMRPLAVEPRHYDLVAERDWEIDLEQMESLIDQNTAAIVVNNPNNPTGAVYSREHLESILRVAQRYRVPVIADEIYGDMVFGGARFHPLHSLEPKVPILTCDGISKRYLVPGWRLGWLIIHDVDRSLHKVRQGLCQLAQKIVGPCSLMQGALPHILQRTPASFFQHTRDVLERNVRVVQDRLAGAPGVTPVRARGAMYMMIKLDTRSFPGFHGRDVDFIQALIAEESLYCLPGSAFYYPGAIRFVMTHSEASMIEACERLKAFCARHYKAASSDQQSSDQPIDQKAIVPDQSSMIAMQSLKKNAKSMHLYGKPTRRSLLLSASRSVEAQ